MRFVVKVAVQVGMLLAFLWNGVWNVAPLQPQTSASVQLIALDGPAATAAAEISSLAWAGDTLLLITENPHRFAASGTSGAFFALPKHDVLRVLDGEIEGPLSPFPVPLVSPDIPSTLRGWGVIFDGFEGAVVVGDQIFLLIEAVDATVSPPAMRSYVVSGSLRADPVAIDLNVRSPIELPQQTSLVNVSYESLTVVGDSLLAIYEVNSHQLNPDAYAIQIDISTYRLSTVSMPPVAGRITDVTDTSEDRLVWALDCCFAGDVLLNGNFNRMTQEYGLGIMSALVNTAPQLIPLRSTPEGLVEADTPRIPIISSEAASVQNWEGLTTLDNRGFLIATDRFPGTLFGFIASDVSAGLN